MAKNQEIISENIVAEDENVLDKCHSRVVSQCNRFSRTTLGMACQIQMVQALCVVIVLSFACLTC